MKKSLTEHSGEKGDTSQDYINKTGRDVASERMEVLGDEQLTKQERQYKSIHFQRELSEVLDATDTLSLDIPKDLLHPEYEYAWEYENRVPAKQRLGWEPVPEDHFGKEAGVSVVRPASKGSTEKLRLLATPKKYVEARAAKREQRLLETENAMSKGSDLPKEFVVNTPRGNTQLKNSLVSKN